MHTRKDEIKGLLVEAESIFHEHKHQPDEKALGPLKITPVIYMGEGKITPPRDTSLEGNMDNKMWSK
jgi:hypothetical protein